MSDEITNSILDDQEEYTNLTGQPYDFGPEEIDGEEVLVDNIDE